MQNANSKFGAMELLVSRDVLGGMTDTLNQFLVLKSTVTCQELLAIIDSQTKFLKDEYNLIVQVAKTGQQPTKHTERYTIAQMSEFAYGLDMNAQPKKPMSNISEVSEAWISGRMLGALKSCANVKMVGAIESTNPVLRRVIADSIPNNIEMAYEIALYMNKKGFYLVPQFAPDVMTHLANEFTEAT